MVYMATEATVYKCANGLVTTDFASVVVNSDVRKMIQFPVACVQGDATLYSKVTSGGLVVQHLPKGADTLAVLDVVGFLNGAVVLADAVATTTIPAIGVVVAVKGNFVDVLVDGVLLMGTVNTPDAAIYLSGTAGDATETPPALSGNRVQQIGVAVDATHIRIGIASEGTLVA